MSSRTLRGWPMEMRFRIFDKHEEIPQQFNRTMKTIDLTENPLSATELLDCARGESVLVKSTDGTSFVVSAADELTTEVELLRRNHKFLTLLDEYEQDQTAVSLEEVERRLQ